jgi:hypothetical protein
MVWDGCRVGRIVLVELGVVLVAEGDRGRLQGRQKWLGGMLDGEAPVSCPGHVVGTSARRSGGLVVVSRFLKSAIQMNFAENQSWPARRLGRAAVWESPGGPTRETAPGGAQGELQGRQSQVGRGGSVPVLLLLALDVCIHPVVWSVVRPVRQKVILTLITHGLMRSVGGHVISHVLL